MKQKLNTKWILWFHSIRNNWTIDGYKKLLNITYLEEFLLFINNYEKLGGINNNHYFLMRDNILPIWEDPANINGGCISIKLEIYKVEEIWNKLCMYIISETIPDSMFINGISICIKNPNYSIIQLWLNNKNSNIINFISSNINSNYIYKSYNMTN